MPRLFALTLFVSSALLFLVQPMIGRMVLPLLGGSPAVWNTCMVFFQAALLAGYAYAHAFPSWLGDKRHAWLHLVLLVLPLVFFLPIALRGEPPSGETSPILWLLQLLLLAVGLPFFVVATSSPLLQRWFAASQHPSASDPYYLYAASNLGSLAALVGYPLLIEPLLSLGNQGRLWMAGYVLFLLLTAACAVWFCRTDSAAALASGSRPNKSGTALSVARRLRWLLLAFVPSSLMLSVTTYLTTDIAAIPLLWVAPLALYLLTFVLAFARKERIPHAMLERWIPLLAIVLTLLLLSEATEPINILIGLHLLGLFWISLYCHSTLARDRPSSERLTEFYLWLSIGGVLGGVFNALVAPLLFRSIIEYPLVLILACFLRPASGVASAPRENATRGAHATPLAIGIWDFALPAAAGLLTVALIEGGQYYGLTPGPISVACMIAPPLIFCYTFKAWPRRFALGIAAIFLSAGLYGGVYGHTLYRIRSFFGVHRVTLDPTGAYRLLVHGNTVHGQQSVDPKREREPLTYYYRTGPVGELFAALSRDERLHNIGVVGLGSGAMMCYAAAGQQWTFYEIDPAVVSIARDSGYFTFLSGAAVQPALVLGDARRKLTESEARYGLLVIDAFSSDAIPVHLLTREALQIYLDHLSEDGILFCNISNRYLDLENVLADLARHCQPSLVCLSWKDLIVKDREKALGKAPSHWVALARSERAVSKLLPHGPWKRLRGRVDRRVWTDDYSNLLSVLKWKDADAP